MPSPPRPHRGGSSELGLSIPEALHKYLADEPELAAGFAVWLCSGKADRAKGRYLSANWDAGELADLKDTIQTTIYW